MLTLDNLISVISLCLTSLGIGITIGYALGQIHAKKPANKSQVFFYFPL